MAQFTATATVVAGTPSIQRIDETPVTVTAVPGNGGTLLIEYTTSSESAIAGGTATWTAWPFGTVNGATTGSTAQKSFPSLISAIRMTATSANGTVSILAGGNYGGTPTTNIAVPSVIKIEPSWLVGYFSQSQVSKLPLSAVPLSSYTHAIHGYIAAHADGTLDLVGNGGTEAAFVNSCINTGTIPLATILSTSSNSYFFTAATTQQTTFITNIVNYIVANNYAGIAIDAEDQSFSAAQFNTFIQALRTALPSTLLLCVICEGGFANTRLVNAQTALDKIMFMNYDLDLAGGAVQPWPHAAIAKYGAGTEYRDTDYVYINYTLNQRIPPNKLILLAPAFVSYYKYSSGYSHQTLGYPGYNNMINGGQTGLNKEVSDMYASASPGFDKPSGVSWISSNNNTPGNANNNYVWYVGPESLGAMANYVKTHGWGGMGLFDLSYEYNSSGTSNALKYPLTATLNRLLSS